MTQATLDHILGNHAGANADLAKAWLNQNGLPTRKNESWKYTNPDKFISGNLTAPKSKIDQALSDLSPYRIYFKGDKFDASKSNLPSEITVKEAKTTASALNDFSNALNALNAKTTLSLTVAAKAVIDQPIIIIHDQEIAPNLEIVVESMAQVAFLEAFSPDLEHHALCTPKTTIDVKAAAKAQHIKTVIGGPEQIHIATTTASLARDATLDSFVFAAGSKLMRQDFVADINESGAHVNAHGLFALRDNQHADQHVTLNHKAAHTTSDQLFKMVLDDSSRGVFTGRLEIFKDAQKVDASQLNKNLVLSKKAHVDTRPQLLVHADDVKCAHGATVGQLSPEEVFYLRSRGLPQDKAQKMLCHAFACDAVLRIESQVLQTWVNNLLFENFEQFALEKFEQ